MFEITNMTDEERLDDLEVTVDRCFRTSLDMYAALKEIRDDRLYRVRGYDSFQDYCKDAWDLGRDYVDRCIVAVEVRGRIADYRDVCDVGQIAKESQLRELVNVPDDSLEAVLVEACDIAESQEKRVTAKIIKKAKKKVIPPPPTIVSSDSSPKVVEGEIVEESEVPNIPAEVEAYAKMTPEQVAQSKKICLEALAKLDRHLSKFTFFSSVEQELGVILNHVEAM